MSSIIYDRRRVRAYELFGKIELLLLLLLLLLFIPSSVKIPRVKNKVKSKNAKLKWSLLVGETVVEHDGVEALFFRPGTSFPGS